MNEPKPKEAKKAEKTWNSRADTYDEWYKTFRGAVENQVDWKLLGKHLPKDKDAKILDAAGGTGRVTFPLAKMGYSVTLCDISPRMLSVAKRKMLKQEEPDRVEILQCDIRNLCFADESFDFVLCWNGAMETAKELIRVARKGGRVSLFLVNRCRGAIDLFLGDPTSSLALMKSGSKYVVHHEEKHRAVNAEEARKLFEGQGIKVVAIYAVCGWMHMLGIPEKVLDSRCWDKRFFEQTADMVLKLSEEPSVKGMSKHLVLYGEKM